MYHPKSVTPNRRPAPTCCNVRAFEEAPFARAKKEPERQPTVGRVSKFETNKRTGALLTAGD
jgi:hypothetical protein